VLRRAINGAAYVFENRCVTSVIAYTAFVQNVYASLSICLSLSPFYYLSLSPLSISTVPIRRTIDKLGGQNHQVRTILCPFCVREANYAKPNVPLTRFDLPTLHGICNEARKGSAIYNTRIYNLIPYSAGPFSEQE